VWFFESKGSPLGFFRSTLKVVFAFMVERECPQEEVNSLVGSGFVNEVIG
jgi:hypothetical protein